MASTASGVTIMGSDPTTTPLTPLQDHFNNLGLSLNGRLIVPVASTAARATTVTARSTDGSAVSSSAPLYDHRADAAVGCKLEVSEDGSTFRVIESASAWTTQALATNFAVMSGYGDVRYRGVGASVQITGSILVRSGATLGISPNWFTVATLASGFRPTAKITGPAGSVAAGGNFYLCLWQVLTTGEIQFYPAIASATIGTGGTMADHIKLPSFAFER